ncbi:ubiquitin-conjugating enzyme [Moniliophthora roreri]|nr:ubiquitin-conjugating enzyme [Moniliophthora roreri]
MVKKELKEDEKGIGDGSCPYGLEDVDDIMIRNLIGMIIGSRHARAPPTRHINTSTDTKTQTGSPRKRHL